MGSRRSDGNFPVGDLILKHQFGPLTLSEDDRRILAGWAADCAERVLPIFERVAPQDSRPREAIEGARAFARGELRIGPARALSAKAHAAAREVSDPAAIAAARAAGHAVGIAHMGAHARGVVYAAIAAGLAEPNNPKARVGESNWQIEHATYEVRTVMRKLPKAREGRSELASLIFEMHSRLENKK